MKTYIVTPYPHEPVQADDCTVLHYDDSDTLIQSDDLHDLFDEGNWTYCQYYWNERRHKRTGKLLDAGWDRYVEYPTLEEAIKGMEQDRKETPNLKFKLVRRFSQELSRDEFEPPAEFKWKY